MSQFLISRLIRALLTIIIVVTACFFLLRASGDPALMILGNDAPPDAIEAFRKSWGLDQSLWIQYVEFIGAVLHGNLGLSMRENRDAMSVVLERVPITLALTVPAFLLQVVLGVSAGVIAALYRRSAIDRLVMALSMLGFTVPSFVLGLVLSLIFAVKLRWLPATGSESWQSAILPIVTLGLAGAAVIARFTRSAMVEVLGQPYVRTASAKGIVWRNVVSRHALPNAAIPIVTVMGFLVGYLVAGALIVENVFSWPGIGRLLVLSVTNRDFAVVQCILILIGITMVTANFCVDLLYGWLDPRLRIVRRSVRS
jgi:peptide/nickel transport system permease protein